jgi:nucleoside-diphosphate-sugar epimerase
MKLFVTGAGGYIGGSVAIALLAAGHQVRGLTRGAASADRLAASGIEPVIGSLDDAGQLTREARAADGVINAASADHAGAVQASIDGLEGSSKPLLHTSGSSVVGDDARGSRSSEQIFDEDSTLVVSPAKKARHQLDLHVLAAAALGIRSVVICPSLIYGVGRGLNPSCVQIPFLLGNALEHGVVQLVGAGLNIWSHVHIDDVVQLYLLALDRAPAGAFYFAENGEASFGEIGAAMARRLGLRDVQSLRAEVAASRWGETKAYYTLGSNSRVRGRRARRELGWAPRHASAVDWIEREMVVDEPATNRAPVPPPGFQS